MERDKIIEIMTKQRESLLEVEQVINILKADNTLKENELLKSRETEFKEKIASLEDEFKKIKEEKKLLNEKYVEILNSKKNDNISNYTEDIEKQVDSYIFKYEKQLKSFELMFMEKLKSDINSILIKDDEQFKELKDKLTILDKEVNEFIIRKREEEKLIAEKAKAELEKKKEELYNTPLTEEEIQGRLSQKLDKKLSTLNLELKFGGKVTSIVGILLIMISVMYGAYLTYVFFGTLLTDFMKMGLIYILGFSLIGLSEYFKGKTLKSFYTSLLAGGIGILYLATTIGYFVFDDVLSISALFIILILLAIITFILAIKNNMQIIALLAIIGGYMPFFDMFLVDTYLSALIFYTLGLNCTMLVISIKQEWKLTKDISLVLNFITNSVLIGLIIQGEYWSSFYILMYSILILGITINAVILYPIKHKKIIGPIETIVLTLNIIFNLVIVYYVFELNFENYVGYIIFTMGVIYFILAKLIEKKAEEYRNISDLLYFISIATSFIALPIQFTGSTLILLTIIESTILILYGKHINKNIFDYFGKIAMFVVSVYLNSRAIFEVQMDYLVLIIANISILFYIFYKNRTNYLALKESQSFSFYKLFIIYLVYRYIGFIVYKQINIPSQYTISTLIVIYSVLNILISKIEILKDKILNVSLTVFSCLVLGAIVYNGLSYGLAINIYIGMFINIVFLANVYCLIIQFNKPKEYTYLIISSLTFSLLIQAILSYTGYGFNSYYLSLSCLVVALIYIGLGFKENIASLRKFMITIIYILIAKIFLLDLEVNSQVERVIVLFIFGVVLILISYFYQKFAKKLYEDIQ